MNLDERTLAVISGAASGLGKATLEAFVDQSARVLALDIDEQAGRKLEQEHPETVIFQPADVSEAEQVESAIQSFEEAHGPVEVAVNCAGIGNPERVFDSGSKHDLGTFQQVIQVNLVGTFNVLRCAAASMAKNQPRPTGERGVLVNTSSVAAFEGQVGQAAYSASKGGIVGMTLSIARDLAEHHIRCMTIAPGVFDTPLFETVPASIRERLVEMTPFPKRMGKPGEFAQLVQSIVENPMLNGDVIRLDGGIRMAPT